MELLIWQMRMKRGYSCRELSKKSGLSKSTINNIENDKTSPTIEQLQALAKALDCRVVDLFRE